MYQLSKTPSESTFAASELLEGFLEAPLKSLASISHQIPIDILPWTLASDKGISVSVRRDDLLDPALGGNKFYKLAGHLQEYSKRKMASPIVSFGGAWSNHLYALAEIGRRYSIETIAIIRGKPAERLSPTLLEIKEKGTRLCFISRVDYRRRNDPKFCLELASRLAIPEDSFWIPEGGSGALGALGCREIGRSLSSKPYDTIGLGLGTGTTMTGLIQGLSQTQASGNKVPTVVGISALRSRASLARDLCGTLMDLDKPVDWMISNQFHCGGFAKYPSYLRSFVSAFEVETGLCLDRVYTAKLFYAFARLIKANSFAAGSHILLLHTGGTQGNRQ